MKIASPSTDDGLADLLARAEAKAQENEGGAPAALVQEYIHPDSIDLSAERRRTVVWFRPWLPWARPAPTFELVEPEGSLFKGQAVVWRSRPGEANGPWLALALSLRNAGVEGEVTDVAGCWRHFWRRFRAEIVDGENWEVAGGDHPVAQQWLELALREAVDESGIVKVFPAEADSDRVAQVQQWAQRGRSLGYMNAWRRAKGEHQRKPARSPSLHELYIQSQEAVRDALDLLGRARLALTIARTDRDAVKRRRHAERRAHPWLTTMHDKKWREMPALTALDTELSEAQNKVNDAKRLVQDAETSVVAQQVARDEAAGTLQKGLAASANGVTKGQDSQVPKVPK